MSTMAATQARTGGMTRDERFVILASSLGTVFEWYDFYLYGSLASIIGAQFFSAYPPATRDIFALLAFAAGFLVRPFGAIVFGRIGDIVGRKYTFLVTILIMGLSTFIVGLLPNAATIGFAAPVILIGLRLAQGLALGGEYGGAATYLAEHAPKGKRGLFTSWIQTTATLGFFLALAVILACRLTIAPDNFKAWGWRIPFLVSVVLLGISVYIRLRLQESPIFAEMKSQGRLTRHPLRDSFFKMPNARYVWLALLGATAGQGVVWYCGQFQALYFLSNNLKLDYQTTYILIGISLLVGTPFFIFFGWLSDRIGRKTIMMTGCLLAALSFIPLFKGLTSFVNPALEAAQSKSPVILYTNEFKGIGDRTWATITDAVNLYKPAPDEVSSYKTRQYLRGRGVPFEVRQAKAEAPLVISIGDKQITGFDDKQIEPQIAAAGYPKAADPSKINYVGAVAILILLVIYVTMFYGPIAAFLVELFPTQIRYTSMSFPYHIGNGWFGGFLPFIVLAITTATGNFYAGLWYPIIVALMTFIIGTLFVRETKDTDIRAEHGAQSVE